MLRKRCVQQAWSAVSQLGHTVLGGYRRIETFLQVPKSGWLSWKHQNSQTSKEEFREKSWRKQSEWKHLKWNQGTRSHFSCCFGTKHSLQVSTQVFQHRTQHNGLQLLPVPSNIWPWKPTADSSPSLQKLTPATGQKSGSSQPTTSL